MVWVAAAATLSAALMPVPVLYDVPPLPLPVPLPPLHVHGYWAGGASNIIRGVVYLSPAGLTAWLDTMVSVCSAVIACPSTVAATPEDADAWKPVWSALLSGAHRCPRYYPYAGSQQLYTALCAAVIGNQRDLVRGLIQAGVDLDASGCPPSATHAAALPPIPLGAVQPAAVYRSSPLVLALSQGSERIALDLI